jgi:hypothetical protein
MAITKKKCEYCKKKFNGIASAKYCCDVCRVYAWRKRKSETAA